MNLDDKSKIVLRDIFRLTRQTKSGVDAVSYRAGNEEKIDLLDNLERDGFLRKENYQYYWVSLVGISLLNDDETIRLLSRCEKIFHVLRTYYKSSPHDQLKLIALSEMVEMPIDEIRECLSYMVEGSWWGSHSDFYATEDAHIKPSESILRYKSFHNVIEQLQQWVEQRIADRMNWKNNPNRTGVASFFSRQNPITGRTDRQKPDWYEKLDSDYQALLDEVYLALAAEMRALPAMGLRTVIDMICNKLIGDIGGFDEKLRKLLKEGHISINEKEILSIAVDVGHASAHRGHTPIKEDLNTLLDIVEHLLKGIYVLHPASQRLKATTPKRNTTSDCLD